MGESFAPVQAAAQVIGSIYCQKLSAGIGKLETGIKERDPLYIAEGAARVALGVNLIPYTTKTFVRSFNSLKNNVGIYDKILKSPFEALKSLPKNSIRELDSWHFFFSDTFLGKKAAENSEKSSSFLTKLRHFDKNLYETKLGQKIVESLGGEIKEGVALSSGEIGTCIAGSGKAAFMANVLAKTTVIGAAITTGLEIPAIIRAYKNGDASAQTGRSILSAASSLAGTAIGWTLCGFLPPIGPLVGAFAFGVGFNKAADLVGQAIFGKPLVAAKQEATVNNPQSNISHMA